MEEQITQINLQKSYYTYSDEVGYQQPYILDDKNLHNFYNEIYQFNKSVINNGRIIYEPEYFLNANNLNQNHENHQTNLLQNTKSYIQDIQQSQNMVSICNLEYYNNKVCSQYNLEEIQLNLNEINKSKQYHDQFRNIESSQDEIEIENDQSCLNQKKKNYYNLKCLDKNENETTILIHNKFSPYQMNENQNYQHQQKIQSTDSEENNSKIEEKKTNKTQNCLKNIIKAFLKHFKQMKECKQVINLSSVELQNQKKQLMRYMKHNSFSYSVIKYLTSHKIYKLLLLNFLESHSTSWLSKSKVVDKQQAQQKILFLINCIKDTNDLDQLNNY
ncbi:hypothetical protein ABPG74_016069 [Tetrahymena malaccensis]